MTTAVTGWTSSKFVRTITQSGPIYWILVAAVFSVARIATWGYPYDSDHWIFYYVGQNWIVEGGSLYVDAWDHKPPMIFLLNGVMAALLGDSIVLHRIWLTAFAVLDAWLFYLLARQILPRMLDTVRSGIDRDVAVKLALLLYVCVRNLSQFTSSGNNTENYGVVLVLVLALAFLRYVSSGTWWWLVLAGFACGLLFWFKGNFLIFGAVIGVLLLIHGWKYRWRLVGHVLAYIAPIVLVSLGWFAYFLSQGTFDDFWLASFGFSAKYATSAWSGSVSANVWLFITTAALAVPALIFLIIGLRDTRAQLRNPGFQLTVSLFVAGLVLIGAVGSFYAYYLLITMPFTVLVIMYGMLRVGSFGRVVRALIIVMFVGTLVANYAISMKQLQNSISGVGVEIERDSRLAAEYIDERTSENEPIFANVYGAVMYQIADRPSGSRFISASVLLLDHRDGFGFGFNDIFMSEMEANQTRFVVFNDLSRTLYAQNTELDAYFAEHFESVASFGTIEVLERVER